MTDSTTERLEENKRYATDTIEEIISETHDIDTLDFHYAVNIVEWLEKHHPRALALITEKDATTAPATTDHYGNTSVHKIRAAFNDLRRAIRAGDIEAAEHALDRYEPWADYVFEKGDG